MPSTPISIRASFTASNFPGWITASSLVIGWPLRHRGFPVVAFFAMLRQVETLHFVFGRHSHANGEIDDLKNDVSSYYGEQDRDTNADRLISQLAKVPVHHADGKRVPLGILENRIDGAGGEDAGQQRANGSASAMHAEGIERVVVTESGLYDGNHRITKNSGDEADQQCRHRSHKSRSGGNCDQTGDGAGDRSQHTGLAVTDPLGHCPSDRRSRRREMRRDKRAGCEAAGTESTSGIESKPAHPEQAGADKA